MLYKAVGVPWRFLLSLIQLNVNPSNYKPALIRRTTRQFEFSCGQANIVDVKCVMWGSKENRGDGVNAV